MRCPRGPTRTIRSTHRSIMTVKEGLIYSPFALSLSKRSLIFVEESFDRLRTNGIIQTFPSFAAMSSSDLL